MKQHAERRLHRIFDSASQGMSSLDDPDSARLRVRPHSALAGDDDRAAPFHVSHDAIRLITASLSQIDALGHLVRKAGALHNHAPYTLARAAIETAGTAVWLLAPRGRTDRILRRLALAAQDARDGDRAAQAAGIPVNRPLAVRLAEIDTKAQKVCGSSSLPSVTVTSIVAAAQSALANSGPHHLPLVAWMACSGFAHGRLWAEISLLDREIHSEDVASGVVRVRLTNDITRVWWATENAYHLLNGAVRLFDERNRTR